MGGCSGFLFGGGVVGTIESSVAGLIQVSKSSIRVNIQLAISCAIKRHPSIRTSAARLNLTLTQSFARQHKKYSPQALFSLCTKDGRMDMTITTDSVSLLALIHCKRMHKLVSINKN